MEYNTSFHDRQTCNKNSQIVRRFALAILEDAAHDDSRASFVAFFHLLRAWDDDCSQGHRPSGRLNVAQTSLRRNYHSASIQNICF